MNVIRGRAVAADRDEMAVMDQTIDETGAKPNISGWIAKRVS